jgi:hypothetical protein
MNATIGLCHMLLVGFISALAVLDPGCGGSEGQRASCTTGPEASAFPAVASPRGWEVSPGGAGGDGPSARACGGEKRGGREEPAALRTSPRIPSVIGPPLTGAPPAVATVILPTVGAGSTDVAGGNTLACIAGDGDGDGDATMEGRLDPAAVKRGGGEPLATASGG